MNVGRVLDRIDAVAARWPRTFAVVGFAWMIAVAFDHGRIIDLPDLPFLTGPYAIASMGLYNAVWWGVLWPRIEKRRAARGSEVVMHG